MIYQTYQLDSYFDNINVDNENRIIKGVFSTELLNRNGHIVDIESLQVDSFLKNPIVCIDHELITTRTVGRAITLQKEFIEIGNKQVLCLTGSVEFAKTKLGIETFELYASKFLRGFSITFAVVRPVLDEETGVYTVYDAELREITCTVLPADLNALSIANALGLETKNFSKQFNNMNPSVAFNSLQKDLRKLLKYNGIIEEGVKSIKQASNSSQEIQDIPISQGQEKVEIVKIENTQEVEASKLQELTNSLQGQKKEINKVITTLLGMKKVVNKSISEIK